MEHNHQYVFRRRITLWTDHIPLVSIMKKPLGSAPMRLQRLLLRLQHYDVEIKYKPGNELYLADTLSRANIDGCHQSEVEDDVESIHTVHFLPVSESQLEEIRQETAKDPTIRALKKIIQEGWPDHTACCVRWTV